MAAGNEAAALRDELRVPLCDVLASLLHRTSSGDGGGVADGGEDSMWQLPKHEHDRTSGLPSAKIWLWPIDNGGLGSFLSAPTPGRISGAPRRLNPVEITRQDCYSEVYCKESEE